MRERVLPLCDLTWQIRRGGLPRGLWRVLRSAWVRLGRRMASHQVTLVHVTELASWPDYQPVPGVVARVGGPGDVDRLRDELPPSLIRLFHWRLNRGQVFFVAEVEGKIGSYAWVATEADSHAARAHGLRLGPGECVHYGSVTLPRFRRRGLYTELQKLSRAHMRGLGYTRLYGGAVVGDPAPERMAARLGLKPVHLNHERWRLGFLRTWTEPAPSP